MAMDVEESIRANPLDGVVLLCGCDKTTPAQLMGAASADIPAIMVPGGPMLAGQWRDQRLGSGTDGRKLFDLFRTGRSAKKSGAKSKAASRAAPGHCTVMGTASTMTSLAEAMGMTLPGCASIPAPDSRRLAMAEMSGRRIVEMVNEDLRPSRIMTRAGARERHYGGYGDRRIHQCSHPSDRHRRAPGHRTAPRRIRPHLAPHAVYRQCQAFGRVPDGRFLLCRRACRQ